MRVLIVEDTEVVRREVAAILAGHKHLCDLADNGLEGVKLALTRRYDLILSDLTMPVLDGFKFIARVRKSDKNADTPILVFSALRDRDSVAKAMTLGIQGYVVKPIVEADLLARVRSFDPTVPSP